MQVIQNGQIVPFPLVNGYEKSVTKKGNTRGVSKDWEENAGPSYVPLLVLRPYTPQDIPFFFQLPVKQCLSNMRMIPNVDFFHRLKDDISNHFEVRIQLFLQQLLLTYQTEKTFACGPTYGQVGSGKYDGKQTTSHLNTVQAEKSCFAAAHSSTVPCLTYRSLNGGKDTYTRIDHDHFNNTWNVTVLLPKHVNDVDSYLDGKNMGGVGAENKLRWHALRILNKAAETSREEYTPLKGVKKFIDKTIGLLGIAQERFKKALVSGKLKNSAEKLLIVGFYKETALSYQTQLTTPTTATLLCKKVFFCVSDTRESLDGNFFKDVQKLMPSPFNQPLALPPALPAPTTKALPPITKPIFQTVVKVTSAEGKLLMLGQTGEKYKLFCLQDNSIREFLRDYVQNGRDDKTSLENRLKCAIKNEYKVGNPQKISCIAEHVLYSYKTEVQALS